MKKIVLSAWAVAALSSVGFAGGDMAPVEPVVSTPMMEEEKTPWYAGLAVAYNQTYSTDHGYFDDSVPTQDETGKLVGQLGYNFHENIGVEGRIGTSFFSEDYASVSTYSIFLKPQYPISEDFTIYGLLGFGIVQVDGTDGDEPAHPSVVGQEILGDTAFQWGIGVSYSINEAFSVFVDYTRLASDADISSTLYGYDPVIYDKLSTQDLTIGVSYHF
jgi:opacity protein-like surface antigen